MKFQYHIVDENQLKPFISDLRAIEKSIEYPLDDGTNNFYIDHGKEYSPFFTQQGHKTRFLIITQGKIVVGSIAAVWKKIFKNRKIYNGLYASDLKLRPEYRSKGVVKNFLWYLFFRWPFKKDFQKWDFSYFCAMQRGSKGVEKTFKGVHLGKLSRFCSTLNIYILGPKQLNVLDIKNLTYKPKNEVNLSPNLSDDVLWNDGKKNIISTKNNSILKLGHLNPNLFHLGNTDRFVRAIKKFSKKKKGQVCFAVDCRNRELLMKLEKQKIYTETKCKVFSFPPLFNPINSANYFSISTGEI